jgi:hypothetical protein
LNEKSAFLAMMKSNFFYSIICSVFDREIIIEKDGFSFEVSWQLKNSVLRRNSFINQLAATSVKEKCSGKDREEKI